MTQNTQKLYSTLWRWHFYAGLFCIPFIISLSVTGAIFLFKPQINAWIDKPYQNLSTVGERASPSQQIETALNSLGNAKFKSYRLPENERQAVVITLIKAQERHLVYVHPYTLEVLKTLPYESQFIRIVQALHGKLLLGNLGSFVIELAGCWALVLIITGLYLWWPRTASGLAGVVYPRLSNGNRKFWRDLHAVTGFWVATFTLFLIISGLPWTLVWGGALNEIRTMVERSSQQETAVHVHTPEKFIAHPYKALSQTLLDKAQSLNYAPPAELGPDTQQKGQWALKSYHQNRMLRANAYFSSDGMLLKEVPFSKRSTLDKAIGIGVAAHEGHLFGWPNQLLGLLVTLGLILVSVSGFILWRKRKPPSSLGAPKSTPNNRAAKPVFYITLGLSVLLPVLAISLVIIVLVEKLLLKRLPVAKNWLGI